MSEGGGKAQSIIDVDDTCTEDDGSTTTGMSTAGGPEDEDDMEYEDAGEDEIDGETVSAVNSVDYIADLIRRRLSLIHI